MNSSTSPLPAKISALELALNKIIHQMVYVIQHFNMHQVIPYRGWGGNEIGSYGDADSKRPLHNSPPTRQPFPICLASIITPRWISSYCLDSASFLCPYRSYLFSLQCYGTALPSPLTCLMSAPPHRASVTCGARKLPSLISCHQNVLA